MNGTTRVSVLTPPGTGAIATVEVAGPRAWELARLLFRPAGQPLPETSEFRRFWLGTLGAGPGDEVILAVTATEPEVHVEVHCHGGQRIVRWIIEQFTRQGRVELVGPAVPDSVPAALLTRAPTLRTASILLDQVHGLFGRAIASILKLLAYDPPSALLSLQELARFAPVGRHLIEPWKVVVAGPPNVGKSSLVNALAGFHRAVVSEVAGTTRDVVAVLVAFDGWPVQLTDTAGLREADGLEGQGIERARQVLADANLVVWLLDASASSPVWPTVSDCPAGKLLLVVNKADQPSAWDLTQATETMRVSALTGAGLPELAVEIARCIVPDPPCPGAAVPFTSRLAELVEAAQAALIVGRVPEAGQLLRDCLPSG